MQLDLTHPAHRDLKARAKKRVPAFVWDYLDSATGEETTKTRNETALDSITLMPGVLKGLPTPDLRTRLLGRDYARPFGIAPVGMSGLIWPHAERHLATLAHQMNIPYCLSTVAAATPEDVSPHMGAQGWFQLYPPASVEIRQDILTRARAAGFHTLILTVDVPTASRRERQRRAQLQTPPKITPRMLVQTAMRPAWALGMARAGLPKLKLMQDYAARVESRGSTDHIGYLLRTAPDWDYLRAMRDEWDGPVVVKGVLNPADAMRLQAEGIDAVWVSNHSGRQFDGAPAAITQLPLIREAVGPDYPLIFDSGVRSGLDILRGLALGADFVMAARHFHYGLAAFGPKGAAHAAHILTDDMTSCMGQLGISRPSDAAQRLGAASAQ
ncbi:MAG: alpha-hydroxy acid oxidase [Brevirhabdus sp.]